MGKPIVIRTNNPDSRRKRIHYGAQAVELRWKLDRAQAQRLILAQKLAAAQATLERYQMQGIQHLGLQKEAQATKTTLETVESLILDVQNELQTTRRRHAALLGR